jgi:hypothetical protein
MNTRAFSIEKVDKKINASIKEWKTIKLSANLKSHQKIKAGRHFREARTELRQLFFDRCSRQSRLEEQ